MRRLVAYKQTQETTRELVDTGSLSISWNYGTLLTDPIPLAIFTYNYQRFVVCFVKNETDIIDAAFYTLWSIPIDAIPIRINGILISSNPITGELYLVPRNILEEVIIATGALSTGSHLQPSGTIASSSWQGSPTHNNPFFLVEYANAIVTNYKDHLIYPLYIETTVNGWGAPVDLEITEETALGIDYQAFDVKEPESAKVSVSNSFVIKKTARNQVITGQIENLQSKSSDIYNVWAVDYWIDNVKLLNKARIMVDSISNDSISCIIYEKNRAWDEMKKVEWADFMESYFLWLKDTELYNLDYTNLEQMLNALRVSNEHLYIPAFYGDFFNKEMVEGEVLEQGLTLWMATYGVNGGHICTYVKSVFQYISVLFEIDFFPNVSGLVWDKEVEGKLYFQNRYLRVGNSETGKEIQFYPTKYIEKDSQVTDKAKKTVYDFVKMFIQQTNCIVDNISDNEIALRVLDDIFDVAQVINWSGLIHKDYEFKPMLDGIAQINTIDFSTYSDLINAGSLRRELICDNKNIEGQRDLFKIQSFAPPIYPVSSIFMVGLSEKKSFDEFTLLGDSENVETFQIYYRQGFETPLNYDMSLRVSSIYGLFNSYNFYEEVIKKPRLYKIKKWLTINDIKNINFFAQYWIQELGGSFYINKIKGFNPDKSKEPTEIELIYISSKTPPVEVLGDYYADSILEPFIDNISDPFN